MPVRTFALILGIIYVIVGIAGFIPALITPMPVGAPDTAVHGLHGYLLGIFPVNWLHTVFHLIIGVWGIYAYRSFPSARIFSQSVAIIFGILAVMGLIPVLNTFFGLMPLHGHDIWLHALTALIAAYFGFLVPAESTARYRTERL